MKKTGKKKKVKKGKSKRDSWTHEGGQSLSLPVGNSKDAGTGLIRRQTQEKDERMRRARRKQAERAEKDFVRKKMAAKVEFDSQSGAEALPESSSVAPAQKRVREQRKSSRSLLDRLSFYVKRSSKLNTRSEEALNWEDTEVAEKEESSSDQSDDDFNDDSTAGDDSEMEVAEGAEGEINGVDDNVHPHDEEENFDNDVEGDDELNGDTSRSLSHWVFAGMPGSPFAEKPALLAEISDDLQLLGQLPQDRKFGPVCCLADLPGLHKLWRSRREEPLSSSLEEKLLPYLCSFPDMFVEGLDMNNDDDVLRALVLNMSLHVVKARANVIRNNSKLSKRQQEARVAAVTARAAENNEEVVDAKTTRKKSRRLEERATRINREQELPPGDSNNDYRDNLLEASQELTGQAIQDQGYCRPRVLILCPFRNTAARIVRHFKSILGKNTTVSNEAKFLEEFGDPEAPDDDDSDDKERARKPIDWKRTFAGNIDDDFKIGIQVNPGQGKGSGADKGVYLRLFSDFYLSDIILASPLGLRLTVENSNGALNYDFLSSIEMVLLHQADVLFMQNWDHVSFILANTNTQPHDDHGTDFARVRPYFLEGAAKQHRQFVMTSGFNEPALQATFRTEAQCLAGKLRLRKQWGEGCLGGVICRVQQIFQKVSCENYSKQEDIRFRYFCDSVLSQLLRIDQGRTLIVTPSYFSYVRVRNELMKRQANAAYICEYSRESEISRGRSRFFHGEHKILLYSGRSHFFRRFKIRGAMHLIFYSLPEYPHFYPELVNALEEAVAGGLGSATSCLALFTPYEKMALERIVGEKRARHMLSSSKATFMFQ